MIMMVFSLRFYDKSRHVLKYNIEQYVIGVGFICTNFQIAAVVPKR